jgi:hypothetical protein
MEGRAPSLDVRVEPYLACLAAALTATSAAVEHEHQLVSLTRDRLTDFSGHAGIVAIRNAVDGHGCLAVAMQMAQLDKPPEFAPIATERVPGIVRDQFADPPAVELSPLVAAVWNDVGVEQLLHEQAHLWAAVAEDVHKVLAPVDLIGFQRLFWGAYPYSIVVVPLASFAPMGIYGIGLPHLREAHVVCLLQNEGPYSAEEWRVLLLAQHEASHPVLNDLEAINPSVPDECEFVEEVAPPGGTFVNVYPKPSWRWGELMIRASSYFFYREIGRDEDAESFLYSQDIEGAAALPMFIAALEPWWDKRKSGNAAGMSEVLTDVPSWLRRAAGR